MYHYVAISSIELVYNNYTSRQLHFILSLQGLWGHTHRQRDAGTKGPHGLRVSCITDLRPTGSTMPFYISNPRVTSMSTFRKRSEHEKNEQKPKEFPTLPNPSTRTIFCSTASHGRWSRSPPSLRLWSWPPRGRPGRCSGARSGRRSRLGGFCLGIWSFQRAVVVRC